MAITTNGGAGVTADSVATLSNKTLEAPTINNATFTGAQAGLEIKFGNNIVLEGTTEDAYEMTLSGGDPTADRTVTLPDVTGTVITTGNLSAITSVGVLTSDIVFEGSSADDFETTLTVTDPTADRTITFPDSTGTVALTSDITITSSSKLSDFSATTSSELAGVISDETGSGALVFGTSPTLSTAQANYPTIKSPQEITTVSATAATGTINFDTQTQTVLYYTTDASANWTVNFRGDGSNSLDSLMDTADSITCVFLVTQGATAYYNDVVTIDGSSVTPKWQGGTAPSAGNASSIDAYSYTIVKTGSAAFTVFASQTKFA